MSVDFGQAKYDTFLERFREKLCRVSRDGYSINVSRLTGSRSTPSLPTHPSSLGEWNLDSQARVQIDLDRHQYRASNIANLGWNRLTIIYSADYFFPLGANFAVPLAWLALVHEQRDGVCYFRCQTRTISAK